ncbi:glutathione S-transferase N-terminal domain-containing protein, partial [Pseudomonas carnis]
VDTPQYRAMNPNGRVPVIEDGDFVLWESNTIVRYLCAKQASDFYPSDLQARANAEKWMDWTTSTLADPFKAVFWGIVRTPADQQNWDSINAGRQACIDALKTVEQALAEQPYLSGQAFGMGDIPLGCFIYAWFEMPIERPAMPHLEAWYQRLQQRPAYRKAVMTALT